MANPRALDKRRKSIKNIRKITRTMELIATARFKKALDRATEADAYTRKISELAADLSKNAGDLIKSVTRLYNRTRQANITKEISELIAGSEALK